MPADNEGLFDLPEQATLVREISETPITEAQIQSLRKAFAAASIDGMDERKAIIESVTIRPVATIRELLARDVRPILRRIEQRRNYTGPSTGSAWDNREEDTWIDRM